MALPKDQQPSQVGTYEKILTIANRIMNGGEITKEEAIELIHTSDDDTMILQFSGHLPDRAFTMAHTSTELSLKCWRILSAIASKIMVSSSDV